MEAIRVDAAQRRDATCRLKALLAAGVAAASVAVIAAPASAASIYLDKAEMFTPAQATISGPPAAHYDTVTAWNGQRTTAISPLTTHLRRDQRGH